MNDRPHAAELLKAARAALAADILPALPETLRYTGLMLAHAIAIVERELMAGDTAARAECDRLRVLLPGCPAPVAAGELSTVLARYNRRLADDIRAGRFDGEYRDALLEHLRQTTREKLAVSNPKALEPSPPTPLPGGEGRKLFPSPPGRRDRDEGRR
jgi:hypothetical protein